MLRNFHNISLNIGKGVGEQNEVTKDIFLTINTSESHWEFILERYITKDGQAGSSFYRSFTFPFPSTIWRKLCETLQISPK